MLLLIISNTVGTESLHIYLHSKNMVCLHVEVIGVCNLCVHTRRSNIDEILSTGAIFVTRQNRTI